MPNREPIDVPRIGARLEQVRNGWNADYTALKGNYPMWDVNRYVRNTIHNNGVYYSRDGKDHVVSYRGIDYEFRHGKPIDVGGWDLLLTITDDLRQVAVQVVRDKNVASINSIPDPFRA